MTIKHHIFNRIRRIAFALARSGVDVSISADSSQNDLFIITVAYNHVRLIEKQIELVKRYVTDKNYRHIIVDNSPKRSVRQDIKEVCKKEGVDYVEVPIYLEKMISHRIWGNGISHGIALNWMYYHVIRPNKPKCFALLDHDVFPLKEYSLTNSLGEREFFGVERNFGVGWYLWPGWCVFRFDAIDQFQPNFLPVYINDVYLDTGGGNFRRIFNHFQLDGIGFPQVITKRVKKTEGLHTHYDIYHSDCLQYIDNAWLHIINGSNYAHTPGKEAFVDYIIDNIERCKSVGY